jgi:hypothetical protein
MNTTTSAGGLSLSAIVPRPTDLIGDSIGGVLSSALDEAMKAVWEAATWLLNIAFSAADTFSTFSVDPHVGPVGAIWPTLLTVSIAIALGLFFWQLTLAVLRGGRGMMQVATGPVAYGIALAMTVAGIAAALTTADGLTSLILSKGLNVTNFSGAFTHTSIFDQALNGAKAVALGLIGFFGLLPAAIGWVLEIIWRQAAILVLVATVPITASGLLAHTTASWFWRGLRWTIAAIAVKPVLALIVVIGVSSLANTTGPVGVLAGVAVLWVSLTSPIALFRLLAFVEPGTDSGHTFRQAWTQRFGGSAPGFNTPTTNASPSGSASGGAPGGDSGVMGAFESANTARFDAAGVGSGQGAGDTDIPAPVPSGAPGGGSPAGAPGSADGPATGSSGDSGSGSSTSAGRDSTSDTASSTGGAGYEGGGAVDPGSGVAEPESVPAAAVAPSDVGPAGPAPHPGTDGAAGGAGSRGAVAGLGEGAAESAVIL